MDISRYNEEDFIGYLQDLIDYHKLEGAALGITKLVIDKGYDVLSDKQKFVFNKEVIEQNSVEDCTRCASDIPWCEMIDATDNGGYCSYCAHMMEKAMRE